MIVCSGLGNPETEITSLLMISFIASSSLYFIFNIFLNRFYIINTFWTNIKSPTFNSSKNFVSLP